MYTLNLEKLGIYDIYCLSDEKSESFVKFVPEKGATISDFRLNNQNIYDGYQSFEDLEALTWYRGILLAPFPNRLQEGKYSFEGIEYQFPINDSETETALHGFMHQMKFTLGEVITNNENASVTSHTSYEGNLKYYPFPFTAEVQYSLDKKLGFSLRLSVTNNGQTNMPIGLGWHPYFQLTEHVNDTILTLADLDMIEIDKNMIPTGNKTPFSVFETPAAIDDFVLDNCFKIDKESKELNLSLQAENHRLIYSQKSDIPFLQIFTPPHRKSIAIEPMTCNVDAFNNEDGLKILAPDETIILECQINLELLK